MRVNEITNDILKENTTVSKIDFKITKRKNVFALHMYVGNEQVGTYEYSNVTNRHLAEIFPEYKGKGFGKLLVLKALETAVNLGMDFIEDESRTREYDNVIDSLENNGYIVNDDGYLYLTQDGLDYLKSKT